MYWENEILKICIRLLLETCAVLAATQIFVSLVPHMTNIFFRKCEGKKAGKPLGVPLETKMTTM